MSTHVATLRKSTSEATTTRRFRNSRHPKGEKRRKSHHRQRTSEVAVGGGNWKWGNYPALTQEIAGLPRLLERSHSPDLSLGRGQGGHGSPQRGANRAECRAPPKCSSQGLIWKSQQPQSLADDHHKCEAISTTRKCENVCDAPTCPDFFNFSHAI